MPYLLALQRLLLSSRSCVMLLPFALFLNCFHGAFCDELIISPETAAFMQVIRKPASGVDRHKALIFNLRKVHIFECLQDCPTCIFVPELFFKQSVAEQ